MKKHIATRLSGKPWFFAWLLLLLPLLGHAATDDTLRQSVELNDNWTFSATDQFGLGHMETVNLPHSWNASELWDPELHQPTGIDHSRGPVTYRRDLAVADEWRGRRLFLRFEAANLVADVSINGSHLGQHRGGYSAFVFEITDAVRYGQTNDLEVVVDNSHFDDIPPLKGDFNIYGGLIRPVSLLITHPINITPADFASSGIYLRQENVSADAATVSVVSKLDNGSSDAQTITVTSTAQNDTAQVVANASEEIVLAAGESGEVQQTLHFENPRLWQGTADPFLYRVKVTLSIDGSITDRVSQQLGLRDIKVDPERGVFLNGKPVKLKGVALHEDWAGSGAALRNEQREQDMRIMQEMGVNALRLAHYPHGEHTLNLADRAGMLVWSEIPLVGFPIGRLDGFRDTTEFKANTRQQLQEMIRQRFNHPSIAFWGLYNELPDTDGEFDARHFIPELQALAKEEDPTRLTTSAAFADGLDLQLNNTTDLQFWNRYFGWYYGEVDGFGPWADETHAHNRQRPIGISEYGSGASVRQQRNDLVKPYGIGDPVHEENWQAHQHEHAWRDIAQRDYLAGSFVWAMFDFSSAMRRESDNFGLNDKGLVTYDRSIKKDSYYFYKANWTPSPMVHLAGKRNRYRSSGTAQVKAYSNLAELELWVNGISVGKQQADDIARFIWPDVQLVDGNNTLRVTGTRDGVLFEDRGIWSHSRDSNTMIALGRLIEETFLIASTLALLLLLFYLRAFRFSSTPGGTILARVGFFVTVGACALYVAFLVFLWQLGLLRAFI